MKTALVTGSSRGIGRAIAIRLGADGYHVTVHCAGKAEAAQAVVDEIIRNGGSAEAVRADLRNTDETASLCERARNVDVLVLNASIQYLKKWDEITLNECYDQLNCNYVSSLMLMQAAVGHMKAERWGRIVAIGSVQERKPHPMMLIYSSAKAAIANTVHSLALQLAEYGITVNDVAPGVIDTDRNTKALSDEEYRKKVVSGIPMGYIGKGEDIAAMVSLLCSDEGRYITGQSIFVDGGNGIT